MKENIKQFQVKVDMCRPEIGNDGLPCGIYDNLIIEGNNRDEIDKQINEIRQERSDYDGWFVSVGAQKAWNPEFGEYQYYEGLRGIVNGIRNTIRRKTR